MAPVVDDARRLVDRKLTIGSEIRMGITGELSCRLRHTSMEVRVLAE